MAVALLRTHAVNQRNAFGIPAGLERYVQTLDHSDHHLQLALEVAHKLGL
jgi:hypothetical protein